VIALKSLFNVQKYGNICGLLRGFVLPERDVLNFPSMNFVMWWSIRSCYA